MYFIDGQETNGILKIISALTSQLSDELEGHSSENKGSYNQRSKKLKYTLDQMNFITYWIVFFQNIYGSPNPQDLKM